MLEKGSFIIPLYNYENYLDKGPVYFYILIFFQKIFGNNNFSFIFPSQISFLLILIYFYKFLKIFKVDEEKILLSILILSSSIQFHFLSKAIRMDILLSFFIIFGYYYLIKYLKEEKNKYKIFFGLSFGFALLTKGPVALIWFLLVPLFYGILEREKKLLNFLFNPLTLIFSFSLPLLWLFLSYNKLGTLIFIEIFQKQTMGRIYSSFAHKKPLYFYFYALPLSFFPYTFFLPFSIFRKNLFKENKFFISWFFLPFIIFSLISGKISIYLLPLSPPLSFSLSSFFLSNMRKIKKILATISILFLILITYFSKNFLNSYPLNFDIKIFKFLFLWLSLVFTLFFFKNKNFPFYFSFFALIFMVLISLLLYPLTYSISYKEISLKYSQLSKNQNYGYAFWDIKPSFIYYSKKPFIELHYAWEIKKYLNERNYILIKEKHFDKLSKNLKKKIRINYKYERLGEDIFIISSKDGS